ncbi:hypothetical protein ACTTAM_11780 [Rhodobacter capsulatus]|uniref:hypothetical protein n=1 Tax=Rhodobacter capsulatus TaxID=1061 RepID=UPI0040260698
MRDLAGKPAFWRSFALFQGLDAAALAALAAGRGNSGGSRARCCFSAAIRATGWWRWRRAGEADAAGPGRARA